MSHGSGQTLEASQDAASLHALKCLAELGLESVSGSSGVYNTRGFNPLPNTTTAGNIPAGTLPPSSGAIVGGNIFPATNSITNSMQQQNQALQNRPNSTDLQGHITHHSHPLVQDVSSFGIPAQNQQRVQHMHAT